MLYKEKSSNPGFNPLFEVTSPLINCRVFRTSVARCFVFKPKIQIWVNYGKPWNEKGWYSLWLFGIYYGHMVHLFYGRLVI
jgi:hypothetical protein